MIYIKTDKELKQIEKSANLLVRTLKRLKKELHPGIKTKDLDDIAQGCIVAGGGVPAFKDYRGYPCSMCISLNEVVIHGIPSDDVIKDTDLVSIDVGVNLDGYYSDAAFTVCMKKAQKNKKRLVSDSERCLYKGIDKFKVGGRVSDISHAIQESAEGQGYSVVKQFVGHGIGTKLHEDPQIPNFGPAGEGEILKPGMVFAIEVMINAGESEVEVLDDGWTTITKDRNMSAHFEHTVCLTKKGTKILTKI